MRSAARLLAVGPLVLALAACGGVAPVPAPPSEPLPSPPAPAVEERPPDEGPRIAIQIASHATDVAVSPDGALVALLGERAVRIADTATGAIRAVHAGCADRAAFSPDGGTLAATGCGTPDILWDLRRDRVTPIQAGPEGRSTYRLQWSTDGTAVALERGNDVAVADAATGALRASFRVDTRPYRGPDAFALSPDGRWIATAHDDGPIRIWDLDGQKHAELAGERNVHALAWSADSALLATGNLFGTLAIWDVASGAKRAEQKLCGDVQWLSWSPSRPLLAAACGDSGGVAVVQPDGAVVARLLPGTWNTHAVDFDATGEHLFAFSASQGVIVWDAGSFQVSFQAPKVSVSSVDLRIFGGASWSRDLGCIAVLQSIYDDYVPRVVVHRLDASGARTELSPDLRKIDARRAHAGLVRLASSHRVGHHLWDPVKDAYDDRLRNLALTADGKTALRDDMDVRGAFEAVDVATGAVTRLRRDAREASAETLGWTPRGTYLVGVRGALIRMGRPIRLLDVWDPRTGVVKASAQLADRSPRTPFFAVSQDESVVALFTQIDLFPDFSRCPRTKAHGCVALQIVELARGKPIATTMTDLPDDEPPPLAFNAAGSALSAGGDVYDGRTGARLFSTGGRTAQRAWTPDGSRTFSIGDGKARVWDLSLAKAVADLEGVDEVLDASPDGAWILARAGSSFALWETATWRQRAALPIAGNGIMPFFSPDGRFVYWGSDMIGIYRVSDGQVLHHVLGPDGPRVTFTPEGTFDGDAGAVMFRLGPDILHAALAPAARFAGRFAHPGLLADFLAGEPVSPR